MCSADAAQLDQSAAEAFGERMADVLNCGALALMTSVGHRVGLFDAMDGMPPSTSAAIATAAGLNERYVREWLGAMVTGRIVVFDPDKGTYHLPAEHAAYLTRAASPDNLAVVAQFIPLLGQVEDPIVECFKNGGGVPYAKFPRFHTVMAEESGQTVVAALIDSILPLAPGVADALGKGIDVLDVGCGSGRAINMLAKNFPTSRFAGYDISEEAIGAAKNEAKRLGLTNARFEVADVARLNGSAGYDLITAFDSIHDQAAPAEVLAGIVRLLRPGGTFLMQDIAGSSHVHKNMDHPVAPLMYTISCMHCMTVSLSAGGAGLGAMWGRELAEKMLGDAGFTSVDVKQLPHDFLNLYYVAKR